jgi:hypothetical protein
MAGLFCENSKRKKSNGLRDKTAERVKGIGGKRVKQQTGFRNISGARNAGQQNR